MNTQTVLYLILSIAILACITWLVLQRRLDQCDAFIVLNGERFMILRRGEVFVDPGATGYTTGGEQVRLGITGQVLVDIPGTYTITYSIRDIDDTMVSTTREVTVLDN